MRGTMRRFPRAAARALAASIGLALAGCGGGGVVDPPPPTPAPTPPPPAVVSQGSMALETEFVIRAPFTTQRAGRVDVEVDWTYATNDVDVILTRGVCTFAQFEAMQCEVLSVAASTSVKPERLSIAGAAAGSYTLFIVNLGPEDDSVAWQVVLSASAASASTSAGWWSQAEPTRARLQAPWLKR